VISAGVAQSQKVLVSFVNCVLHFHLTSYSRDLCVRKKTDLRPRMMQIIDFSSVAGANSITGQKLSVCVLTRVAQIIITIESCNPAYTDLLITLITNQKLGQSGLVTGFIDYYCTKLSSLQHLWGRHLPTHRSKTANITKDDITLQHIAKVSLCCELISSFVIFAVLDLRVGGCRP